MGHQYNEYIPEKNFILIHGEKYPNATNILRLDGLYFGPKGIDLNRPIFQSYNEANHIIFQSNFSKEMYFEYAGPVSNYSIIHNGTDIERVINEPREFSDRKIAAINCRNRPHKRLKETIEAFADPKLQDVTLIVFGISKQEFPYASTNVIFAGQLPNSKILETLHTKCDVLLHPAWLDWCPNAVVEAQALGIPVLCNNNGGTKELIELGVICPLEPPFHISHKVDLENPPPVDMQALVRGILRVIDIPRIQATPEWRARYSIYSTAEQYITI